MGNYKWNDLWLHASEGRGNGREEKTRIWENGFWKHLNAMNGILYGHSVCNIPPYLYRWKQEKHRDRDRENWKVLEQEFP